MSVPGVSLFEDELSANRHPIVTAYYTCMSDSPVHQWDNNCMVVRMHSEISPNTNYFIQTRNDNSVTEIVLPRLNEAKLKSRYSNML